MASPSDSEPQACLLVYNGQCRLCVAAKQPHADASPIQMVPYQSEEARQALGSPIGLVVPTQHSWFARMGGGANGFDAFLAFLPGFEGGRVLSALLSVP